MSLVDYPESDDSDTQDLPTLSNQTSGTKWKRPAPREDDAALPPLPDSFHNLYATTARLSTQDDPTLHAGRQRQTPHVEGNWPTHVYIEWFPSTGDSLRLQSILDRITPNDPDIRNVGLHSLLKSDLGAERPLHISLSRPIGLLSHQRQPFLESLTVGIRDTSVSSFRVNTADLDWVPNDDSSRWFLVLRLQQDAQDQLSKLLLLSNKAVVEFGQPPLYATHTSFKFSGGRGQLQPMKGSSKPYLPPKLAVPYPGDNESVHFGFHVSIAWALQPPTESSLERARDALVNIEPLFVDVSSVKVKMGNAISVISLSAWKEPRSGIIAG